MIAILKLYNNKVLCEQFGQIAAHNTYNLYAAYKVYGDDLNNPLIKRIKKKRISDKTTIPIY